MKFKGLFTFLGIFAVLAVIGQIMPKSKPVDIAKPESIEQMAQKNKEAKEAASAETNTPDNWTYSTNQYGIDNKESKTAEVKSTNAINLQFPYSGSNYGHLTIRNQDGKLDVIFTVDKGQFNRSYTGSQVKVKFDEEKTKVFTGHEPSDHSSGWLFLGNAKRFITAVKGKKHLKIETEFFREGTQLFEFDIDGLDLNKVGI